MKLAELKHRFKQKYTIRIIAGVLVVVLAGGGVFVQNVSAADAAKTVAAAQPEETGKEEEDSDKALGSLLGDGISVSEKETGKEETVYVITDSLGNEKNIIVSDHLYNRDKADILKDASTLKDIENVKGDETFSQNGSDITWQAGGNDIYYQGTSAKDVPVSQKITYYLDGKEISPDDLAGKSGKVKIRFDYTNREKVKAQIAGKEEEVFVPFMAISGIVLDDSFSDVKVKNGKVISDGNRNVVVGYALPGLKDSLKVKDSDFDAGVSIPDYVEVSADVKDFSLDMTMTVVTNAADFVNADGTGDTSAVEDLFDTLTDATDRLQSGSSELAEGVDTLKSKMGDFKNGVGSLKSGIETYTDGASTLSTGIGSLKNGVDTLVGSVPALTSGVTQLKEGSASAANGAGSLKEGADTLAAGAKALDDGVQAIAANSDTLAGGAKTVSDGAAAVNTGIAALTGKLGDMGTQLAASKAALYTQFAESGVAYENASSTIQMLEQKQQALVMGLASAANGDAAGAAAYFAAAGVADANAAAQEIAAVTAHIASLQAGMASVDSAAAVIDTVAAQLGNEETQAQLAALQQGAGELAAGAAAVSDGAAQLAAGAAGAAEGSAQVAKGASDLGTGAASLKSGLDTLDGGLGELYSSTGTLVSGANQLKEGTDELANGAGTLVANNQALKDGAAQLADGTDAITDGVGELSDGAHQLAEGIVEFNEKGIEKILNSYNGDMQPLIERMQAVLDAGKEYQSYTDIADGVSGSVKFIYKADAIKTK